jgi:hypothetical protein
VDPGISIEVEWFDNDVAGLWISAANGRFAGSAQAYAAPGFAAEMAELLLGFPEAVGEKREWECGTFDATLAGGGVHFTFAATDSRGYVTIKVQLRADPRREGEESASFDIRAEPAAIDAFVQALRHMPLKVGAIASLRAA